MGELFHEDEEVYHKYAKYGMYMSSHLLNLYRKSPYKYHQFILGAIKYPKSQDFAFGKAAHKLILEGMYEFDNEYLVSDGPVNPATNETYGRTTKKYKEWESSIGKGIVCTEDYDKITKMEKAVWKNPNTALFENGEAELVGRADIEGVPCQIRMDYFRKDIGIIDLKTCRDIDLFNHDIKQFGYHYQMAFYRMVLREITGIAYPVHIVAVDKTDFAISGRWDIPETELDLCEKENRAALKRFVRSLETNIWTTGYEEIRTFSREF